MSKIEYIIIITPMLLCSIVGGGSLGLASITNDWRLYLCCALSLGAIILYTVLLLYLRDKSSLKGAAK